MPAVAIHAPGGPEALEDVRAPIPEPATGEVLIRVDAAGVNRADVLERQGRYPIRTNGAAIPGLEVAGRIAQLGAGVTDWQVGERVCTLTDGGGYARYARAPAIQLLHWPEGYDGTRAACLPEAFFTAWANVFQQGRLRAGETLLVHGGRGGVGSTAIQLAHALGARVIATSGSPEGCKDCLALGADHALDYHRPDLADALRSATDGRGVDVILDPIGAANLQVNLASLATDGRLAIIGFTGGQVAERVDLLPILARRLVVTGSAMRPRSAAEKGAIAAELKAQVWPLLDAGRCKPVVAHVFPLAQAADAHRLMEAGGYFGKIVLKVR